MPASKLSTPVVVVSLTAVKALPNSMYPVVKIVVASSLLPIIAEQTHLFVAASTRVKTNVPDVNAVAANPLSKSNPVLIAAADAPDVEPLIIEDVPAYPDVAYVGVLLVPNCAVKFPDAPFVDTAYNCNVIRFAQLGILIKLMLVPLVVAIAVPNTNGLRFPSPDTMLPDAVIPVVPSIITAILTPGFYACYIYSYSIFTVPASNVLVPVLVKRTAVRVPDNAIDPFDQELAIALLYPL